MKRKTAGTADAGTLDTVFIDDLVHNLMQDAQAGVTYQELHGISTDMMESVYTYAFRFYQNGQLDEAETFFRFLYMYDFHNGDYALGLAAVHQMKKQYSKAVDMYALSYALLKDDERPMLHVGQCHLATGNLPLARSCFDTVVLKSGDEGLVARARAYLQALDTAATDSDAPSKESPTP